MNAHAHITPTQLALHQAKKARDARLMANAIQSAQSKPANENARVRVVMSLPAMVPTIDDMPEAITKRRFIKLRAMHYGLDPEIILGYDKTRRVSYYRQLIMLELREEFPNASWPDLGRAFGGRDHTTILHGVARALEARESGRKAPPLKIKSKPKTQIAPVKPKVRKVREHIQRITKEQEEQIVRLWRDEKLSYAAICRRLRIADKAPRRVIARRGITR